MVNVLSGFTYSYIKDISSEITFKILKDSTTSGKYSHENECSQRFRKKYCRLNTLFLT